MLPIEAPRRQRNRIGKKSIAGRFDPAVARAFAILAVKEDSTIEAMLTEAVLDILQKYNQPIEKRSEEHTSELQSLMRISYAVFCLKKKKCHTLNPLRYVRRVTTKN